MALRIMKADERLAEANSKTTFAIFGPPGVGKTSLLWTLLASTALCVDLEAGMKSVEDWPGDSIPKRSGWRRHGILVIALADPRLTWPERELVRQLGAKLFGRRSEHGR